MSITVNPQHDDTQWPSRDCTICGANAIGVNFGTLTCAPCAKSIENNTQLRESDWCHLLNTIATYYIHCLKTYISQRSTVFADETTLYQHQPTPLKHFTTLPMNLAASLCSFFSSITNLSFSIKHKSNYLCKNNLRSLLFPNIIEIGQSCFSEPWQISREKATWAVICGLNYMNSLLILNT
ncbi:unnamed protein product [Rotaria socialis]|uniref:Uncharacterized protein n=1 Tax=Rotaria socialis TaxID=392032 RepID=A0A819Z149_9BILA|nr:unnamed protein product [Rotaria socialis]CAF4162803.1 unnamed protein product [Rotaria socialis]